MMMNLKMIFLFIRVYGFNVNYLINQKRINDF